MKIMIQFTYFKFVNIHPKVRAMERLSVVHIEFAYIRDFKVLNVHFHFLFFFCFVFEGFTSCLLISI